MAPGLHWRALDPDTHVGYRRGKRGGVWLARWRVGSGYRQHTLGTADDVIASGNLSYEEAVRVARETVEAARRLEKAEAEGPPQTVRNVLEAYIAVRDARETARRGKPGKGDAHSRLTRHVLSNQAIAERPLHSLTEKHLGEWADGLDPALAATTRRRLVNDLKAALNDAVRRNWRQLPPELPQAIRFGLKLSEFEAGTATRDNQILSDTQVRGLIIAAQSVDLRDGWDGDLYRLVLLLAATGARYSQLTRLRVVDVQPERRRIMVPGSRKGRTSVEKAPTPVPIGSDVVEELTPAITGRAPTAVLLERWKHRPILGRIGQWERSGRDRWGPSAELTRPFCAVATQAGMFGVTAYALRHSSIVRHLRIGTPVRLVAALHDTSVAMIERHYAAWIADGLEELAARGIVPLVASTIQSAVQMPGTGQ